MSQQPLRFVFGQLLWLDSANSRRRVSDKPFAVAVDRAGNLYVVDTGLAKVYKIALDGKKTSIGSGFVAPYAVAVDDIGNVYVTDERSDVIYKIAPNGSMTKVGKKLFDPRAVAVEAGTVYVVDLSQESGPDEIKKIQPDGKITVVKSSGSGFLGLAVDEAGNMYVTTFVDGHALAKITPGGKETLVGSGFYDPWGVAVNDSGTLLYVADTNNYALKSLVHQ